MLYYCDNVQFQLQVYTLPTITNYLPTQRVQIDMLNIPNTIHSRLADPNFDQPGVVDMLIDAEVFFNILKQDKYTVSDHAFFQNTVFGWILTG